MTRPGSVPGSSVGIDNSATEEHTDDMSKQINTTDADLEAQLKESIAQFTAAPAPVVTDESLPEDLPAPEATTTITTEPVPDDLFPSDADAARQRKRTATRTSTPKRSTKATLAAAPKTTPTKRTGTPRGQGYADHRWERRSEDKPCLSCSEPYAHSKGFCSKCYNAARQPLKKGLKGQTLVNAVKERRGIALTPADKRRASKEKGGTVTPTATPAPSVTSASTAPRKVTNVPSAKGKKTKTTKKEAIAVA